METKKIILNAMIIIILGLCLFLTGCSQFSWTSDEDQSDTGITAPSENLDQAEPPPCDLTHHQYPDAANYPPPGYQFIHLTPSDPVRVTDDPPVFYGPNFTYKFINKSQGGPVWLTKGAPIPPNPTFSGVVFNPYGLPYSTWICVYQPDLDEPWIEYEPHGIVFNGAQHAHMNYAGCDLPPGVDPEDLTIWYWNDQINQYEYIGGTNHVSQQYIEFNIYHFSRYVVAAPE